MFSFTCIFFFYFNSDSNFINSNFLAHFGLDIQYFHASSFIFPIYETGVIIISFALRGTERYSHYGASTREILNERGHKQQNNLEAVVNVER